MAMTPEAIRNKTFSVIRKGYDRAEVHKYLASIADELATFNSATAADEEILVAEIVEQSEDSQTSSDSDAAEIIEAPQQVETADVDSAAEEALPTPEESIDQAPSETALTSADRIDDFDRVGNEISIMLRQAQESAIKIRTDAEVEARSLVDQVRLDIESDRLAHEQAAGELINRTELRASEVRQEAENYAQTTRAEADEYANELRERAETDRLELIATADAERKLAAEKLTGASNEADATLAEANRKADEILRQAEADAQARADQMLADARNTLRTLIDAEKSSRVNLEQARSNIDGALAQLRLTDVDDEAVTAAPAS